MVVTEQDKKGVWRSISWQLQSKLVVSIPPIISWAFVFLSPIRLLSSGIQVHIHPVFKFRGGSTQM